MYTVEEYQAPDGYRPFREWLIGLADRRAQARILARITRVELGNLGDWKALQGVRGLYELREHYGPGYRVYFAFSGNRIILLLAGSSKQDQQKAIRQAEAYWADYSRRQE